MEMRLAVRRHLEALDDGRDEIIYHNAIDAPPRRLRYLRPDFVVLHTTFLGTRWNEDFERTRRQFAWIGRLHCPKIALPQDEYDHSAVLEEWLLELGATHVFSCFGESQRAVLYPRIDRSLPFTEALTGYIDTASSTGIAKQMIPPEQRPFDIVYRAAKLPYWFGSHGQLKHELAAIVGEPARRKGLRTDISTRWEDTIFGDRWLDFLMSGRAVLGVESGSSVLDQSGDLQRRVRRLLAENPDLTFDEVARVMPTGWDSYAFFAISPRHLEAVVTKTCQILIEGSYSGVLTPDRHYIPLRRDFSNLDEVLDRAGDIRSCSDIADTAYRDIYEDGSYTLERFAADIRGEAGAGPQNRSSRLHLRPPSTRPGKAARVQKAAAAARYAQALRIRLGVVVLLMKTIASDASVRRLVVLSLRQPDRPPLRRLTDDVLRLGVLKRVHAESTAGRCLWQIRPELSAGTLVLRTELGPVPQATVEPQAPYTQVLWDHSAIATSVALDPGFPKLGSVRLGADGRYEFAAFGALASSHRQALEQAFAEFKR
jgi:hypothetical protein